MDPMALADPQAVLSSSRVAEGLTVRLRVAV
jgi:hypothetical protein